MKKMHMGALVMPVILAASFLTGCGTAEEEPFLDGRVTVEVKEALYGNLSLEGKYIGTLSSAETVEIVPMISGVVNSVDVEVGQTVKAGQQLCKFDDSSAQNSLKNAKVSYQSAVSNADSSTGSSWNLEREKESNSIESLESKRTEIEEKIDDYTEEKEDLRDERDEANKVMETRKTAYETAKTAYEADPENVELETKLNEAKNAYEESARAYESANASYQSAKATLNSSIDSLESQQKSLEEDIAHAREIQQINETQVWQDRVTAAQNSIEAARVGVEAAEYQVGLYTLSSPVSGVVEQVNVTENNFASTGTVAFSIAADTEKVVTWYVTEDVRNEILAGQSVSVEYNGNYYDGTISEVGTAVDLSKGLFKIKAVVYGMEEVSNGVSVEIAFVAHSAQDQIIIPVDAVYYDNGEAYVYLMEDGLANIRAVRQGISSAEEVAIESGLEEGDLVITSWSADLKDGAEVVMAEEQ